MTRPIGKKRGAVAEGFIPGTSTGPGAAVWLAAPDSDYGTGQTFTLGQGA